MESSQLASLQASLCDCQQLNSSVQALILTLKHLLLAGLVLMILMQILEMLIPYLLEFMKANDHSPHSHKAASFSSLNHNSLFLRY